jgi:hypothetical protein
MAHVDRVAYKAHIDSVNMTAIGLAVEIAGHVGSLRHASVKGQFNLYLTKFPIADLIDARERGNMIDELARMTAIRSKESGLTDTEVKALLSSELEQLDEFTTVCNSHDIDNVLAALIRNRWGGPSGVGADGVSRSISSSVDWECFQRLRICTDLRAWGKGIAKTVWRRDIVT